MNDVLLVIDVLNDFEHQEGERLHNSFEERFDGLRAALAEARAASLPVIFVNDNHGDWRSDRRRLVQRALAGKAGKRMQAVAPLDEEPLLIKARYSAFDHTSLDLLLAELKAERLLLIGGSTEGCIVQTGIDAREHGYKVTILTAACMTADEERERTALAYAESVAGIILEPGEDQAAEADTPLRSAGRTSSA